MASNNKKFTGANTIYFTPDGLAATKSELEFLKSEKRNEIAERIQVAREDGGTQENAEYDAALEEQSFVETKITELEKIIRVAKVINEEHTSEIVTLGSTVKIKLDGKTDEFTIVGRAEANPLKKKISNESPVGSALLGSKKGDTVEITTPQVSYKYKVIEIR